MAKVRVHKTGFPEDDWVETPKDCFPVRKGKVKNGDLLLRASAFALHRKAIWDEANPREVGQNVGDFVKVLRRKT